MSSARPWPVLLVVLGLGCQPQSAAKTLPPASGAGAPALPTLPTIASGGLVAASEGRTTGTTTAREEAQIGPAVQGTLTEIRVREGDRVRKGDVLFRQDARDAQLRVEQAKAGLEAAKIGLKAMEVEANRVKTLVAENALNRAQWEQLEPRLEGAKNGVAQAQIGLEMAEKYLADTIVRAPMDGVVTMKLKAVGEMATTMPPTVVLILQDQGTLELRFRLSEPELARVRPGLPVEARFSAIGVVKTAKVVRLSPTVDPRTRTFEAVAELDNADGALRPGLLAEISYATATAAAGELK